MQYDQWTEHPKKGDLDSHLTQFPPQLPPQKTSGIWIG